MSRFTLCAGPVAVHVLCIYITTSMSPSLYIPFAVQLAACQRESSLTGPPADGQVTHRLLQHFCLHHMQCKEYPTKTMQATMSTQTAICLQRVMATNMVLTSTNRMNSSAICSHRMQSDNQSHKQIDHNGPYLTPHTGVLQPFRHRPSNQSKLGRVPPKPGRG